MILTVVILGNLKKIWILKKNREIYLIYLNMFRKYLTQNLHSKYTKFQKVYKMCPGCNLHKKNNDISATHYPNLKVSIYYIILRKNNGYIITSIHYFT